MKRAFLSKKKVVCQVPNHCITIIYLSTIVAVKWEKRELKSQFCPNHHVVKMNFVLLIFCLILPWKIQSFYVENSNQDLSKIRIQRDAKYWNNGRRLWNTKHQVKPKKKGKINLQKFQSNDAFFRPSVQIPLKPSLAQRSGAAIHYAQPLVAAKNLFHYDNLPSLQPKNSGKKSKKKPSKNVHTKRVKPRIPFMRKKKKKNRQELFRPKFKYSKDKRIPFKPEFQYDTRTKYKKNDEEDTELKVTIVFGEEIDQNKIKDKVVTEEPDDIYKYYEESQDFDPLPKYEIKRPKTTTVAPIKSTFTPKTTTNAPKFTTTSLPKSINYLSKPIKIRPTSKIRTIKNDFGYYDNYQNTEKYYQRPKPTRLPKTYTPRTYIPKTYTPKTYTPKTYTKSTQNELQFYTDYEEKQLPTYDPDQIYDHHDYFNYDHYDKSTTSSSTSVSFFDNFFNDNQFGFGQKFKPPSFNGSDFFKASGVKPTFGIMSTTLPTESPKMSTTLPSERPKQPKKGRRTTTGSPQVITTWPSGTTTLIPKTSTIPQRTTTGVPKSTTTEYSMFPQRGRGTIFDLPESEYIPDHMFYPSTDSPKMTPNPDVRYRKRSTVKPQKIPAPPKPPKPPSIKSLRMLQRQLRKHKIKVKQRKRKKKIKGRIRKKELKEKQQAIKRSLTLQYKVLDFINQTAFWTTFVSVIGFALAMQ